MIELVNTSLPNGLIAGTHGFSTVAMTKGVGDALRTRLEALCAYSHRSSAHDATYASENPSNWFHVVLPQGEHVVGRVAAADFDYTGRTNRLARLLVFKGREMPAAGAAEILTAEREWYSSPWEGEVRYLTEDKAKAERLRTLDNSAGARLSAWEGVLGRGSSSLARQLAWQLEKNIASGGKSIFFRTSTQWDVTGEKLLALFRDIISLLPAELRPLATFSTYPAALPNSVSCQLRGVYDRDRAFDAASVSEVWVDCESGRVVHPEMLPKAGDETARSAAVAAAAAATAGGDSPVVSAAGVMETLGGDEGELLFEPKKEGRDPFIYSVVAAILVLAFAGSCCFYWMMRSNTAKMKASDTFETSFDDGADAAENAESVWERERRLKREREELEEEERLYKEKMEGERLEAERLKAREEQDRKNAEDRRQRELRDAERRAEEARRREELRLAATAYQRAAKVAVGEPVPPQTGIGAPEVVPPFSVFYYDGTNVVVASASFKPRKVARQIVSYNLWVGSEDNFLSFAGDKSTFEPLASSPCVMWMVGDSVMFDWSFRKDAKCTLFQGAREKFDLREHCFGKSDEVYAAWSRLNPKTEYVVSMVGVPVSGDDDLFVTKEREMTRAEALEYLCRRRVRESEQKYGKALADSERRLEGLKKAREELADLQDTLATWDRLEGEIKAYDERIAELNRLVKGVKNTANMAHLANSERKAELKELTKERDVRKFAFKRMGSRKSIEAKFPAAKRRIAEWEHQLDLSKEKVNEADAARKIAAQTDGMDDVLRKTAFEVSVREAKGEGK